MSNTKQGTRWYNLTDLQLWEENPNQGDQGAIITSINQHGYNDVIAVYHGTIMGGNHRLQALQQLLDGGYVPTHKDTQLRRENGDYQITGMDVSHFETQAEANAFALALNRTARLGHDDPAMLAALLQDIAAQDVELMESTGFDGDDLDQLLNELTPFVPPVDEGAQVDRATELQEKWQVRRGDVWVIPSVSGSGNHKILCGDSTDADDAALLMDGRKADAVLTDPPYGVDYKRGKYDGTPRKSNMPVDIVGDNLKGNDQQRFIYSIFETAKPHCNNNVVIYMFSAPLVEGCHSMMGLIDCGIHIQSQLIWNKSSLVLGRCDYHWKHEIIWYGYWDGKGRMWNGGRDQTSVINSPKIAASLHPNEKPTSLLSIFINNSTAPGDITYDPCAGSASTIVACEQTKRIGYGIEIDPSYTAVSLQRLADMGLNPVLAGS